MALEEIAGETVLLDCRGALLLPSHRALVVADLHLEKGSSGARQGSLLPPYDTLSTLALLGRLIDLHDPSLVICLGDSFHDRAAAGRMAPRAADMLGALMRGREWYWLAGNHDPDEPPGLPGYGAAELFLGSLCLRHEPGAAGAEIAGHLHPGARVVRRGRSIRRACFATDGQRLIMPALGAYTGLLNVLDPAYCGLFDWTAFRAHVLGPGRLYRIAGPALAPG
jgi:DNA ligase-associated metallophosphoesterase